MKKGIIAFTAFIFIFVCFAGTALAAAPTAQSYFTNSNYNKTYTGDDGLEHKMHVTMVGETWNKIGTVIYNVYYYDEYTKDGDSYTDAKSFVKSFSKARQTYPGCSHYSVYRINWYADGHSEVIFDYRTSSTPAPTATPKPTAKPTAKPTVKPTTTAKAATAKPAATPTLVSSAIASPAATPTVSLAPTPMPSMPAVVIITPARTSTPTPTEAAAPIVTIDPNMTATPTTSEWALYPGWAKILLFSVGGVIVCVVIFLAVSMIRENKGGNRKGRKDSND